MKIALVFAAVAVTLGAACDTSDVLDAYAQARSGGSNCDRLIDTLSPFFFNGQAPSADVLEPLCGDECSLLFMWNLYESGCADQSQARTAFQQVVDTCECRVDAFFVARGGRCITACTGPVCVGNEAGSHYDEPYLSTEDGHKLQMHVMGATLTLESESSTNRGEGSSRDGTSIGYCEGPYVSWDEDSGRCIPDADYMAAGTRFLSFNNLASRSDLNRLEIEIRDAIYALENHVNTTSSGMVSVAQAVVNANAEELNDLRDAIGGIAQEVDAQIEQAADEIENRVADLTESLEQSFQDLQNEIDDNVLSELEALSGVADDVNTLMDSFEHTAFLDHSKPVYRWGVWSSYCQWQGWYGDGGHGDASMFGGITPQQWGDGNGRAWQLSGDKNVLRGLFNKRGYMGWQGTMFNEEWMSHSSTNSKHCGTLFRIRNTGSQQVTWRVNFYYSSYAGWSERASATVNGQSTWESGGNYCGAHCSTNVNFNIPANRVSTVIIIAASSPRSSGCCDFGPRGNWLAFRENTLRLPNNLEYVDDMDYAPGGWDR